MTTCSRNKWWFKIVGQRPETSQAGFDGTIKLEHITTKIHNNKFYTYDVDKII